MARIFVFLWLLPRNIAIAIMKLYRLVISPLYGQVCKYHPSCSRYAVEAYQSQGFVRGTLFTGWRLLRCNPWSHGGIDDVPEQRTRGLRLTKHGFVTRSRGTTDSPLTEHTEDMIHA